MDKDEFEFEIEEEESEEAEQEAESQVEEEEGEESEESTKDEEEEEPEEQPEDRKQFGKRAQKRIKSLLAKKRELEAKNVELAKELETSRGSINQTQDFAVQQYESALDSEAEALETKFKEAHEAEDAEELWKVQKQLARVEAGRLRLEEWKRKHAPSAEAFDTDKEIYQQAPQPQQRQPDPKAMKWAAKNPWFSVDEEMTRDALEINNELIFDEGLDPSSDEYYAEIDRRMRDLYPSKFPKRKVKSAVAGTSRGPKKNKNKVTLTQSEKARAERMGIPLERFAKEKWKMTQRQGGYA